MESTYYLIVEQQAGGRHVGTLDECASANRLIAGRGASRPMEAQP